MARRAKQVGFSRAFIESLVPYNLNSFPKEDHVATPILNYMIEHGVLSDMPRYMNSVEIKTALNYGTHSSTVKENSFVRKELDNKTRSGHVAIFQWEDVKYLQGLCLSMLAAIIQSGRKTRLIYDCLGVDLTRRLG